MTKKSAQFKVVEDKYIEVTGSFEIYNAKGVLLKNEGPYSSADVAFQKTNHFAMADIKLLISQDKKLPFLKHLSSIIHKIKRFS